MTDLDIPTLALLAAQDGNSSAVALELLRRPNDAQRLLDDARDETLIAAETALALRIGRDAMTAQLADRDSAIRAMRQREEGLVAELASAQRAAEDLTAERDALLAAVVAFRDARAAFVELGIDAIDSARDVMFSLVADSAEVHRG